MIYIAVELALKMSTYTTVGDRHVSIRIDNALIREYPCWNTRSVNQLGESSIAIYSIVTNSVLNTLKKVMAGYIVIPSVDLFSHYEVYLLIQVTRYLGIPDATLYEGSFKGWTADRRWTDLHAPEYMYAVHSMIEELVDFPKYMRIAPAPFTMVTRAIDLHLYKADSELLLSMMTYFKNFNIELCFDMNNDKVQEQISRLRADKEKALVNFFIDPHAHMELFQYVGSSGDARSGEDNVWSCNGVSTVKRPTLGQQTIADLPVVMERFHKFTCGLFEKSMNPKLANAQFPWEFVAFAGGGATKILSADYEPKNSRQSDVDLFIMGATFEDRKKTFHFVLEWFSTFGEDRSRTYYAIRGAVVSIYIKGVNRKVQIISSDAKDLYDVIGKFDLTHIQWALWKGRYYGTPDAVYAMRTKVSRFSNIRSIKAYRLVKAMTCGYDIEKSADVMKNVIDITSLIEDPKNEQLQTIIRDFHGYYYPAEMPDYEPEDELKHILAMICKDSNAAMATNDPTYVRQNVVASGNFGSSYESISFTTFNPALIMNKGLNRRLTQTVIRTRHGVMRLTSSFLTVRKAVTNDDGCKITMKADTEEFIEFTKLLEGNVYRMFRPGGVTKKLFNESREITVEIPRYVLNAQFSRGYSCIRNQRGNPLNIEEDLQPGDRLQFMFLIELQMTDQNRAVTLKPIKFIKYDTTPGEPTEDADDLDVEIDSLSHDIESACEIKYTEY